MFRTSYPNFSIALFRETPSKQQTISVFFSFSSVESSAKVSAMYVPESDGVSDGVGYRQSFLFLLLEGPRRAFDESRLVLHFVACLIFLSWVGATYFLYVEVVIFFAIPPRLFGCRFRRGTGLMSEAVRKSAEVNGEKLTELIEGWPLNFTKVRWFTWAAFLCSEDRGKSCGLKMFFSH